MLFLYLWKINFKTIDHFASKNLMHLLTQGQVVDSMRSKQEIETYFDHEINKIRFFHEIKSCNNHLISWLHCFSWDRKSLKMHFKLLISWLKLRLQKCSLDKSLKSIIFFYFWSHEKFVRHKFNHEIESFFHWWLIIRAKN
jgi:hypothetical protein